MKFPRLVQNFKYLEGKCCAWYVHSQCVEILTCRWKYLMFSALYSYLLLNPLEVNTLYIKYKITTWKVLLLLLVHKGSEGIFFAEEISLIFEQNHRHSSLCPLYVFIQLISPSHEFESFKIECYSWTHFIPCQRFTSFQANLLSFQLVSGRIFSISW